MILRLLFLALLTCLLFSTPANSEDMDPEYLKTLYTYKFGKFVKWPVAKLNAQTGHFRLCILGRNQFSRKTITMLSGKAVQSLPLLIDVFDSGVVPEDVLKACHILFINASEKHRLTTILESISQRPVLTVSDIHQFSSHGGMITLLEKRGRIRFQINPNALQQAQLTISSKILNLAEIIKDKEH